VSDSVTKLGDLLRAIRRSVGWIHPSYRDLIVDQLATDEALRKRFLEVMNLEGVKLAVSQGGGERGQRKLPLLVTEQDWTMLLAKCLSLLDNLGTTEAVSLIRILRSATVDLTGVDRSRILRVLAECCERVTAKMDAAKGIIKESDLRELMEATVMMDPLPVLPQMGLTWRAATSALTTTVKEAAENSTPIDADAVLEWARLTDLVTKNEPRLMRQVNYPQAFTGEITQLLLAVGKESEDDAEYEDPDELLAEADRFDTMGEALKIIERLFPELAGEISKAMSSAASQEDYLREQYRDAQQGPEEGYDGGEIRSGLGSQPFDVDSLFSDL
jgi:hypothetical protein